MSLRGERFVVDLPDDEDDVPPRSSGHLDAAGLSGSNWDLVGDIVERDGSTAKPPSAPALKSTSTGFPAHKKRPRVSAFKQQRNQTSNPDNKSPSRQSAPPTNLQPLTHTDLSIEQDEHRRIDEENNRRLAAMSEREITEEREELFSTLSPTLIQNLLKRANLDQGRGDTGLQPESSKQTSMSKEVPNTEDFEEITRIPEPAGARVSAARTVSVVDQDAEPDDPGPLQPVSNYKPEVLSIQGPKIHFPTPPSAPELDPSDPSFLENLHEKYFPSLPADPSRLAWMAPVPTHGSVADQDSPYYPARDGLPVSALRFDFRGALLPPRIARAMPTDRGLHHHGEAPEAAGYTIPELARLSRSAFPAQRCIAFQTLGRLLYRLGRGVFGDNNNEITQGLWKCIEEGKVIETLEEAANTEGGHQGSKVYAIEAVWLWQKGGGKRMKAS